MGCIWMKAHRRTNKNYSVAIEKQCQQWKQSTTNKIPWRETWAREYVDLEWAESENIQMKSVNIENNRFIF